MKIKIEVITAVLDAYYKEIRAIYDEGMTPDDFSGEDIINMVHERLENPDECEECEDEE